MELIYSGKVREVYEDRGDVILVASDRVSVYDVVLPTPIPEKGAVLTALSAWWFERLKDAFPNHYLSSTDVPPEVAGRAMRCKRVEVVQVECIARGYLAGLGHEEYRRQGSVSGVELPPGLELGSKLPEPIYTATTKATVGHDEFIDYDDVIAKVGADTAEKLRQATIDLYSRAAAIALDSGVILADTKFEFGWDANGELLLADEIFTSDSSRYWLPEKWEPGRRQYAYDKQFVRDWASDLDWDKTPPGPEVPDEIATEARARYVEIFERITGREWKSPR